MARVVEPTHTKSAAPNLGALRIRARWQRRLALPLTLALPISTIWALDGIHRAGRMTTFDASDIAAYAFASLLSFSLWTSLLVLAAARRGWARYLFATVAVLFAALLLGSQHYAYAHYATYLNLDAVRFGNAVRSSVLNQLAADAPHLAKNILPPTIGMFGLILLARCFARPRRSHRRLARVVFPVALIAMLTLPCAYRRLQPATPDVLLLHALGRTAATNLGILKDEWSLSTTRLPIFIPAFRPAPALPRSVVLIIDESIRADVTCIDYDPACETTPFSNAAAPERIGLRQLRALDSATLVTLGVLWSGLSPLVSNEQRAKSPMLFDIVHAAGMQTAYVTSQNLDFANSRALIEDLPIDLMAEARDLVDNPDIDLGAPDELTAAKAVAFASRLREPFFMVVQFANVHYPFRTDPERAPFQPSAITKDPARGEEFFNHYKNAVHLHDRATGALIEGLRSLPSSSRTILIYTSDHGEAFGEHGQYGHTLSIFDEEVHVPGWIDAPEGALTPSERAQLLQARDAFTWHADFAPTILDLLGVWDAPEVGMVREQMFGTSLLRGLTTRAVPITNCTEQWGCIFPNWGVMKDGLKLEARAWDTDWNCFDVLRDPGERVNLGAEACADLVEEAERFYDARPWE